MRRGLPLPVAADPTTLLAFEMNGQPLPAAHGAPVRLIVPRWAGIASTKWLTSLEVWNRPFTGPFQGELYVVYDADGAPVQPVREMPVKSIIAEPREGETVASGRLRIRGYAWSGYAAIENVALSLDNGANWTPVTTMDSDGPYSWTRWEHSISLEPGSYEVLAKATDQRGISQPWKAFWNQKGYFMNEIQRVPFSVL